MVGTASEGDKPCRGALTPSYLRMSHFKIVSGSSLVFQHSVLKHVLESEDTSPDDLGYRLIEGGG